MNKNELMRHMLMMRPDLEETKIKVENDPNDSMSWYELGMALSNSDDNESAIEAFSKAISLEPFNGYYYFGRGRKHNALKHFWSGVADLTMATRIMPENWTFWYYRATAYHLEGKYEDSVRDFEECIKLAEPWERYPLVHWLYTTYLLDLNDKDSALKSLELIADDTVPPQMDYGYSRCVKLYKGLLKSEEFVDKENMENDVLKHENRVNLELNTMYYGLYAYAIYIDDQKLADEALKELLKIGIPAAFGYKRGAAAAKERGLI